MKTEDIDTDFLINEVKKYPVIWNTKSVEYRDRNKRRAAWNRVAETLSTDFAEKSESEKNIIGQKYMNKWRNIRDQYLKNLKKSKSGQFSVKRYVYAKQLSFLLDSEDASKTQSSLDVESNDVESTSDASTELTGRNSPGISETTRSSPGTSEPPQKRNKNDDYLDSCLLEYPSSTIPTFSVPEIDDDKSFFDSLLPAVRTFTLDQKLEFRSEVLKLVTKIRKSNFPPLTDSFFL